MVFMHTDLYYQLNPKNVTHGLWKFTLLAMKNIYIGNQLSVYCSWGLSNSGLDGCDCKLQALFCDGWQTFFEM